jgi:site-specific DNA recombinase
MMKSASARTVRCAIYTRKSSEEGLEQGFNSLHAQREACEAYVLSQAGEGWVASNTIYDDGGFSGGSIERPALARLLEDVARGSIDVVVVYKVDRLTRSLADFAKIVERFDAQEVSFVSVTQAFNTTSSMGRLTLNVLLSFAQFEREVTGERIRDKLAASRKKGMWMGGFAPLGYAPDGRSLKIIDSEAATVRHIFTRYLDLGSVHTLRDELAAQGVASKAHTFKDGRQRGGTPMNRGAIYHLLANRIYLGQIVHGEEIHPGLHPPLIDQPLFDAVQAKLQSSRKRRPKTDDAKRDQLAEMVPTAFLTGLIRDDAGSPMTPVHTNKDGIARYRYYVSTAALKGGIKAFYASIKRAPAAPLEDLVLDRGRKLGLLGDTEDERAAARAALERVEVAHDSIRMIWRSDRRKGKVDETRLAPTDLLSVERDRLILDVQAHVKGRGGARAIRGPGGQSAIDTPTHDPALVKALVRAEGWRRELITGSAPTIGALAKEDGVKAGYARRMLRLAFLAPDLKIAILDGRAPQGLTLQKIMTEGLSDSWAEQRRMAAA